MSGQYVTVENYVEAKHDLRSPAQIEADAALELAREAAQKAPWWEKVTELDRQKAGVYRDAALARGIRPHGLLRSLPPMLYKIRCPVGIPDRPHGLIPADDPHFRQLHKAKHILPFEKHILFWESSQPHIKGGADGESRSVALHADEGYTLYFRNARDPLRIFPRPRKLRFFCPAGACTNLGALTC